MLIVLQPLGERRIDASAVIRRLQSELAAVSGITLYMQPVQDLTIEDRVSRTQYQYTLEDPNADELNRWATQMVAKLRTLPALRDVASDQLDGGLQASLVIDRDTASRLGVTPAAIDQTINEAEREIALPASIRGAFQGTAQAFRTSLANEPILILAALITVYIVLGVLYESYVHPLTILSTLPSAGVGALLALLLCDTEFGIVALIGIILLIGIVKKNAIMMIDFALDAERTQGRTPQDAIYQACLLRFRPILMTTMAALLAGLPLALGTGTGSELRRPLGIAIVGGLLVSQLITLYTTPVVYLAFDRLARRLARRRPGEPIDEAALAEAG